MSSLKSSDGSIFKVGSYEKTLRIPPTKRLATEEWNPANNRASGPSPKQNDREQS